MQIAIREDQPRFDVAVGSGGSTKQPSGNPFDQIMRAMNARDPEQSTAAPNRDRDQDREVRDDEPARVNDRRNHHSARTDDSADAATDDRPARIDDSRPADCDACVADSAPTRDDLGTPEEGSTTGETSTASQSDTPIEPDQPAAAAQPTAEQPAEPTQDSPANAKDGNQGTTPVKAGQLANLPISEDVLGQLDALLQARLGDASSGLANSPFALALSNGTLGNGVMNHGLMTAVMAQSLAGQQASTAPGALVQQPGQRNGAPAILPGNAAKRAAGPDAQAPTGNIVGAMDFKSIAAALARQPAGQGDPAATASAGTTTGTLDAAGSSTSSSNGNAMAQGMAERAAQTAKADAPAHAASHQRLSGPQFAERIGLTIARAAESGVDKVSIRLNPHELGRIDVKMELGQDGRMNLTVTADRPDTLDQLQRNMRDLERSLNDAGFDTSAGDLNFSLRQDQSSNDHTGGSAGGGALSDGDPALGEAGTEAEDGMIITHHSDGTMVVDLFV